MQWYDVVLLDGRLDVSGPSSVLLASDSKQTVNCGRSVCSETFDLDDANS